MGDRQLERYRIAVLCSEEDPLRCHRHRLIGAALRREGVRVLHVRASGHVQTDAELTLGRPGRGLAATNDEGRKTNAWRE